VRTLVSCPINNLLDPPADFRAGQGAPTRHNSSKGTGEEAQRRPARKDAAQRVSYLWGRTPWIAACTLGLLSACATSQPDHFYILSVQPQGVGESRATPVTQVGLRVTLPPWVDRSEMILNTSTDGVVVLEHERWAAPLAELVTQALGRDIERRRRDMLVADTRVSYSSGTAVNITVDVVQMTVRRGERASIEAHWRILDSRTGKEVVGSEVLSAPVGPDGYAAVAQALSECLGILTDRLVTQIQ
jgi:uncharacterized lipoprotein YmbA